MRIYLTTDTHFNHRKLEEYGRPKDFELLIEEGYKILKIGDILFHLGDVCIGNDAEMHERFIRNLPCKKILVRGNHDGKSDNWYFDHGWDFVAKEIVNTYFGKKYLFKHIPTQKREGIDFQIHGHTHGNRHRDIDIQPFYDTTWHKELALELNNYGLYDLEKLTHATPRP